MDPAPRQLNGFFDEVTRPIIRRLFSCLVQKLGPKITGSDVPFFADTSQQNSTVEEIESLLKLYSRRRTLSQVLKASLPKSLYWLGTACLSNVLLMSFWPAALRGDAPPEELPKEVPDEAFLAAVRFVYRRYLPAQCVLAVTAREQAWIGKDIDFHVLPGDITPLLVRLLRGIPDALITEDSICSLELELKRGLSNKGTETQRRDSEVKLHRIWTGLATLGVGELTKDQNGRMVLHKYCWEALSDSTVAWLQEQRVPCYMFGMTARRDLFPRVQKPVAAFSSKTKDGPELCQNLSQSSAPQQGKTSAATKAVPSTSEALRPQADTDRSQSQTLLEPVSSKQGREQTQEVLVNEVVPGVLLTQQNCRSRLRSYLAGLDQRADVRDVKPIRHDRYYQVKARCLGVGTTPCVVTWIGTYFRKKAAGNLAQSWTVIQQGKHDHADGSHDSGRVFSPAQDDAARAFVAEHPKCTTKDLRGHLLIKGFEDSALPLKARMQAWLKNRKSALKHTALQPARALPGTDLLQEMQMRTLEQWCEQQPQTASDLFILQSPPPVLCDRICVSFTCSGMTNVLKHLCSHEVAMSVDVKQGCLRHGHGVATLSILGKDKLRNTTLAKINGKRVQGRAFTTHANPWLQAVLHSEAEDNFVQFFHTAEQVWEQVAPEKPPLRSCLVQLHKDYAPAIEGARLQVFPAARPVNDFFHFLEHQSTVESKLSNTITQASRFVKRDFGWIMHAVHTLRHLPTLDLYSQLWGGCLKRLRHILKEPLAADYLGAEGHATYTLRKTCAELWEKYGLRTVEDDSEVEMLFSPHWSGLSGILHGTDCGDQPQEAMHSPWEEQLKVLGKDAEGMHVLPVMQELYKTWETEFQWNARISVHSSPPATDPALLNGAALEAAGRTCAITFWSLQKSKQIHVIADIGEHTQVIAMIRQAECTFELQAAAGIRMLFAKGVALRNMLQTHGLLEDMPHFDDTSIVSSCTRVSQVRRFFHDTCYVCVSTVPAFPFPACPNGHCTCAMSSRYGDCEHAEYVRMLSLRVRAATISGDNVPTQQKRGRKKGPVTARSKARAMARSITSVRKDSLKRPATCP